MPLIVEDGTLVANADSYITLAAARVYADSRGLSLAGSDAEAERQLRRGFDYVEAYRDRFKGAKVDPTQMTQWPRYGAYVDGRYIDTITIPTELKYAQVQVAAAIQSGLDVTPNSTGESFVVREKVGPIETQYSESVASSGVPILRTAEQLLAALITSTGALTTERA